MIKTNAANQTKPSLFPINLTSRLSLAAPIMAVALVLSATGALAQNTVTIAGGVTTVTLAGSFVSALGSLDVTPGTVYPTLLQDGKVGFPVTGGAIDLDTALGQILHSGGLTLTAGKTEVTLQSFIIDTTGSKPVITGLVSVNGTLQSFGRVPLFDLALPSGLTLPLDPKYGELGLEGVGVTLDAAAAGALNSVFDVTAFTAGFDIGTANVTLLPLRDYGHRFPFFGGVDPLRSK